MPLSANDLLTVFGEVFLLLDGSRRVELALGDTSHFLGHHPDSLIGMVWTDLIKACAIPDSFNCLYWTVEAALERYVAPTFLPASLPFKAGIIAQVIALPNKQTAIHLQPMHGEKYQSLLKKDVQPALRSIVGFADVLLKNIGGPLNDLQTEDIKVIHNDGQFALSLVEAAYHEWIEPTLSGPVPIQARQLLQLLPDDLPRRRLKSQALTLQFDLPPDVAVYSNGAIRSGLIELIRLLPHYVVKKSQIGVHVISVGGLLEVHVTYETADTGMITTQLIKPVSLFERQSLKRDGQLKTVVSALNSLLTPYGCSAWAMPAETPTTVTIVMTVPLWHGPLESTPT